MEQDEKACPFCAETIKAAAIVCKHCGRELSNARTDTAEIRNPIADLSLDMQSKVRSLGITWQQQRWVVDGCYFSELQAAIQFAERPRSAPIQASARKSRGPLFWLVAIPAAGVALFFGSAVIAGLMESMSKSRSYSSFGDQVEAQCLEDSARARVLMDCKEIRRIAEERRNSPAVCPPEAPDCSWGKK